MLGREKESVPEYLVDVYKSVSFIPSVINRKTGRDPSFPHSTLWVARMPYCHSQGANAGKRLNPTCIESHSRSSYVERKRSAWPPRTYL